MWSCATIVAMAITGCGSANPNSGASRPDEKQNLDSIEVEVFAVEMTNWPTIVRSQGSLFADEQTVVGSTVAGRVAEVHVDLGDSVLIGDPIITLDLQEFQLQVIQAEAQLQQSRAAVGLAEGDSTASLNPENAPPVRQEKALWAEAISSLERSERLLNQNAVSQGEYDLALAAERAAEARQAAALNSVREKIALIGIREAELAIARQRLADATIRAPINGYVRSRQVAPGTYVMVGQPIATIVRTDPLRFRGTVPERYAQALSVGQTIKLSVVANEEPFETTITRVSPALDAQSRALVFEANVPNPDQKLRAGVFGEAEVVIDSNAQALVIPQSALNQFAGVEKVWKLVDGVATEQEVLAGTRRDQEQEIVQGLSPGDQILLQANQGRVARVVPTSRQAKPSQSTSNESTSSQSTSNESNASN
jgi:RND family efflux transporter MFP subunit